jgi:hypothetical protein
MIFMPFPRFVVPISTLGHHERRVDEAFFFMQRTSVAKLVSNIRQHPPQNLIAEPSLKALMYRFVVGTALRQHPQDCFKNATGIAPATVELGKEALPTLSR